jgi:hypothetical protein
MVHEEILMLVCIMRTICSLRDYDKNDGLVKFSSSNVHGVTDDNSNPYRNMIMDAIRMNQGYTGECLVVDEKPNADTTIFFDLLKDSDKPL